MGGAELANEEEAGTEEADAEDDGMDAEDPGVDCICGGSDVLLLSRMAKVIATIRTADKTKISKRIEAICFHTKHLLFCDFTIGRK